MKRLRDYISTIGTDAREAAVQHNGHESSAVIPLPSTRRRAMKLFAGATLALAAGSLVGCADMVVTPKPKRSKSYITGRQNGKMGKNP